MKLNPGDNVAVVGNASTLEVGAEVFPGLFALDALKFGQKVALENIKISSNILKNRFVYLTIILYDESGKCYHFIPEKWVLISVAI